MDYELIFWIVACVAGCIAFGVLWLLGKREAENYVGWIARGEW